MGKLTYDTGHHRRKSQLFDYDFVTGESEDKCLFCLSGQQVAYLLASLEPARWKTRWYSPTDQEIDTDWLDAVFSELEVELMTDHCDLETMLTTINDTLTTINNNLNIVVTNTTIINKFDFSVIKSCFLQNPVILNAQSDTAVSITAARAISFWRSPVNPSITLTTYPFYTNDGHNGIVFGQVTQINVSLISELARRGFLNLSLTMSLSFGERK